MLPSCQSCNLRKSDRPLDVVIREDKSFDLLTAAADVKHLNTGARNAILHSLMIKKNQLLGNDESTSGDANDLLEDKIEAAMEMISERVSARMQSTDAELTKVVAEKCQTLKIDASSIEYDEEKFIDSGGYGEVFQGRLLLPYHSAASGEKATSKTQSTKESADEASKIDVAIKFPRLERGISGIESLIYELEVLNRIQHPNIVKLMGWFTPAALDNNESSVGVVLEYCPYSLSEHRANRPARCNVHLPRIVLDVCRALEFMHWRHCYHRDVKPSNILIAKHPQQDWKDATAKLCDFGTAKFVFSREEQHTYHAGTAGWRAPEVRRGIVVPASDIFSLGKTINGLYPENNHAKRDRDLYECLRKLSQDMVVYRYENRISLKEAAVRLMRFTDGYRGVVMEGEEQAQAQIDDVTDKVKDLTINATPPAAGTTGTKGKDAKAAAPAPPRAAKSEATSPLPPPPPSPPLARDEADLRMVNLRNNARTLENPRGKKNMSYHTLGCRYMDPDKHGIPLQVPEEEAVSFGHSACKICCH